MKLSMTQWIILAVLGLDLCLVFPVANWFLDGPTPAMEQSLASIQEPYFKKAAPILVGKCASCHAIGTPLPFYASLPLANDLIAKDVEEGQEDFEFSQKITPSGEGFTEIDLARIEQVLHDDSMPPLKYTAMHWKSFVTAEDKATLLAWVKNQRKLNRKDSSVSAERSGEPIAAIPLSHNEDMNKAFLGNRLFHDVRLSGNNTVSCASCHGLNKGGTDQSIVSTGIHGQKGGINSPTVFNAKYHFVQFWDGRAADLKTQAKGPVENPIEMGAKWPEVVEKLKADPSYVQNFRALYPEGITPDTVVDAIAAFENTLITPNSRFDQWLRGNAKALKSDELAGYQLFKMNCASCHAGINAGGLSYEQLGKVKPYYTAARPAKTPDMGRLNVTNNKDDKHQFKVPTLRNLAVTGPYLHDGSAKSVRDAVKVMSDHQLKKPLNDHEIDQITAFLATLNGEYEGQPLK